MQKGALTHSPSFSEVWGTGVEEGQWRGQTSWRHRRFFGFFTQPKTEQILRGSIRANRRNAKAEHPSFDLNCLHSPFVLHCTDSPH